MAIRDVDIRSGVARLEVTRYDLVLLAIPGTLCLAVIATTLFAIPQELAIGAGSILAAAVVGDGLFRNPPPQHGPSTA